MGRLIVAAVPLGNPDDASIRLRAAIESARYVAAEDSRKFHRLCKDLGIQCSARTISFFEGNESQRLNELEEILEQSEEILLLTDAGTPGISDPGYRAIQVALRGGHSVEVLPGPSAVTTALLLSGLPSDRFAFEGFLPRGDVARERRLENLLYEERTLIFFEAPHRIRDFLQSVINTFGDERNAAICREMTKTYEEVIRGDLKTLLEWSISKEMLGEFTIVVEGFDPFTASHSDQDVIHWVERFEAAGVTRKEAIAMAAKQLALPKRKVFDILVANK
jgi:16S rRNA (cytidine1402-2'-O)-methyltransferase